MARIRAASNYAFEVLDANWQLTALKPGSAPVNTPSELDAHSLEWSHALCPGTVASSLRAKAGWDWSEIPRFDACEFWYRTRFSSTPCASGESLWLELGGLATLADVWLNGVHVLHSDNMFLAHELDVSTLIRSVNQLDIRFASLDSAIAVRRPRPRFKTRLVDNQQLRWFRTTLLGHIPGWTPPLTTVGPWRGARLVRRRAFSIEKLELQTHVEHGRALVTARVLIDEHQTRIESVTLHVGSRAVLLERTAGAARVLSGVLELPDAERWWPHSYGSQPRYPARIRVQTARGVHDLELDPVAFRSVVADTSGDRFALVVNDVEIRCRGACWVPADVVSLADDALTVATVRQAHAAGMNMLRVGGTMIYESDAFYEECERSGILVWQDFMFANCDYPGEDAAFCASVTREAEQFLQRTETRACLAVLCGNSEVEQQAAMLGLPREHWKPSLFENLLRDVSSEQRPDVPYVASTPTGGTLPFQANSGLTHYYGVGAYLRPLEDARRADVKFTPECLGFANIPEASTIERVLGDGRAPFHDPRWKARVPRDSGPGWDFDDVRDHYTKLLFDIDPVALRYADPERALALARVTTGEVMAQTLAEWRRGASACRGALIWFLRDLWPGAGWGLIDSFGIPKAAYYFVRRSMQSQTVSVTDEGLNGLVVHVANDCATPLSAELRVELFRNGLLPLATGSCQVEVPARGTLAIDTSTLFDHFMDLSYAYRFGPSQYDVAVVRLYDTRDSRLIAQASHFPRGLSAERVEDVGLGATLEATAGEDWRLVLHAERFARAVAIELPDSVLEDSYFDLAPGQRRALVVRSLVPGAKPRGFARPLNAHSATRIAVAPSVKS